MNNISLDKFKLIQKISKFIRRKSYKNIWTNFLEVALMLIFMFFILINIESYLYLNAQLKTIFLFSIIFITFLTFIILILKHIKKIIFSKSTHELSSASSEIGKSYDEIKDNLLNALQLISKNDSDGSPLLINAAFKNIYDKVSHFNFMKLINYSNLKKKIVFLLVSSTLLAIIVATNDSLSNGYSRLTQYDKDFTKPFKFQLKSLTGNKIFKEGNNVELEIISEGEVPDEIQISTKSAIESEFREHRARKDSNNIYSIILRNAKHSFVYFAQKDEIKTQLYNIEITSSPIIKSINFEIIPPKYSSLPKLDQENNGNIIALLGTKVNYQFEATKRLNSAKIVFNDGSIDTLRVRDNRVSGNFFISKNDSYYFEVFDTNLNKNEHPIKYSITIIKDQFPEIKISRPDKISLIPNNDIVSINYSIRDDYGFQHAKLFYNRLEESTSQMDQKYEKIDLVIDKNEIEQTLFYNWDLATMELRENEVVSFYLEVADNDNISGPKYSSTEIYKLRVPTLEEIFAEAEKLQDSAIEDLSETLKEAEELKNELKQIENELKQNQENIEWEEKEKIEKSVKKFEKLAEKIEKVQENLNSTQKQLSDNNLLSDKTMEMYNELQKLMDELNSEEMKKALADMQNSLEQLLRDKVQRSIDNLSMNEELFQKSIERTLNLLKKIQIEQKVDEVIKRAEKISDDLNKIKDETQENSNDMSRREVNDLKKDQEQLGEQLKSLEAEMQKLEEKMSEVNNMPQQKMNDINDHMKEQNNVDLSNEALQQMEQMNFSEAMKNQMQLSQNMSDVQNRMQQMQQQMQQQSQQMVMQNMLRAIDNIIDLSMEQELISQNTEALKSTPGELPKQIQSQMDIKQNLDKVLKQLSELSQNTFAITPEMGEALGQARKNMNDAVEGMQGRDGQKSLSKQNEAMKNLNQAASFLQSSLQAMMQGGGQGGGMMSLMQQLQQMAQQQLGINKMTQMMQQGQLTMQQQAQIQRLAQQQSAIQKSLHELNREAREAGKSKKLTTDLQNVLKEMDEVISGLNTNRVDDDLVKKQEKILSKLLDAQRSINERDFEKNRESFSGKEFDIDSPASLLLDNDRAKDLLREELLKAIMEGYSKDYQDLIRRYFEQINNN